MVRQCGGDGEKRERSTKPFTTRDGGGFRKATMRARRTWSSGPAPAGGRNRGESEIDQRLPVRARDFRAPWWREVFERKVFRRRQKLDA